MPEGPGAKAVKPGSLPFQSAIFRRGLLVVLIPGLLGSGLLLTLNFLWLSTSKFSFEEQQHAEVVMNLGICFSALKNYCYDMMASRNANIPNLIERADADRKAFYQLLDVFSATSIPADLRRCGDKDIFAEFRNAALAMAHDAERLAPSMDVALFNDNLGRFIRYRRLMLRGLVIADDIDKVIDEVQATLIKNRAQLSSVQSQLRGTLAIGLPLGAALALAAMFHFARGIVVRLKLLAGNAENLPALAAGATPGVEPSSTDEFAYLDSVFRQTAQQLRDAAEQRQAIAQMLAHDMRSPIMATQIYVDLLQEINASTMTPEARASCQAIKHNLSTVHDFVSALLVAEKLESEPIELDCSHFFVREAVDEAVKEITAASASQQVDFAVDCTGASVCADRERFVQALKNYLLNAVRFAPKQSTISVVGTSSPASVKFIVRDGGPPAGNDEIDYLFDPFRQAPPEGSAGISALGMNLRIARLIVEAHGGECGGVANLESGREFWFSLPLDASNSSKKQPAALPDAPEASKVGRQSVSFKELLSASSFQNCIMVFAASLILQAAWLFWLDNRLKSAQVLADKAASQSDTMLDVNRLWLTIYRANAATAFFLTSGNLENQAFAQKNVAKGRALITRLNLLFSQRDRPTAEWGRVRSFLLYEFALLKKLSEKTDAERTGIDLGIIGRMTSQSGERNSYTRDLLNAELSRLSSIRHEQEILRDRFQQIIALAIFGNLVMTVWLVYVFSQNITGRLDLLVQVARKIPQRAPVTEMITGNDEIYQIYWLLCRAALNLNEAYEQRKSMMNMVAKDIGLPLAEVQKMLSELEGTLSSGARIHETGARSLKSARDNINRLLALDDDLLGLDQLEQGLLQLDKAPCSLLGIIDASINSVGALALKKQITIRKNCEDIQLVADKRRLVQVLVNLLSNAIKFSPRQSAIEVNGCMQNGRVRLSVKDEGPGISREEGRRIFARFYQTEDHKKQGFGLGLAICSLIVQSHDGEIAVESEIGDGATFVVTLPK